MSDAADMANLNRTLKEISRSLATLVKVVEAVNKNFTELGQNMKEDNEALGKISSITGYPIKTGTVSFSGCTCSWNNGVAEQNLLPAHNINCPALKGFHTIDDECSIRGHSDKPKENHGS